MSLLTGSVPTMTDQRGGALKLLRMAKVRCGAAMAFLVLPEADGSLSVTAHPDPHDPEAALVPLDGDDLDRLALEVWTELWRGARGPLVRPVVAGPAPVEPAWLAAAPVTVPGLTALTAGALCVVRAAPAEFTDDQLRPLATLARRFGAFLEARQQIQGGRLGSFTEGRFRAEPHHVGPKDLEGGPASATFETVDDHDPVTGLPSIGALVEYLDAPGDAHGRRLPGLVLVAVTGRRSIADAKEELRRTTAALSAEVRRRDLVARVGLSTFAVGLFAAPDTDELAPLTDRLTAAVTAALGGTAEGWTVRATAALSSESGGASMELIHRAWTRLEPP